jgi:hypothetical protein
MRSVRARAERLDLDFSHFTGQRRWSDRQLANAVAAADNWHQVIVALGLTSATGGDRDALRAHALRLGLDTERLEVRAVPPPASDAPVPDLLNLPRAGPLLAAAWFELVGASVTWPLEPCRFDLVAWTGEGPVRVQVKTTRTRTGSSWQATLCTHRKSTHVYSPEEIDQFFVIDGDFNFYLIPLAVVGGRKAISLSRYGAYRVQPLTGSPHQ